VKVDAAGTWLTPSTQRFDLSVSEVKGGEYARFVILQDQYSYQVAWHTDTFEDTSTGQSQPETRMYNLHGIYNSLTTVPTGQLVGR
jgi:hypothetical protein